jgi:adenylosuccinate synthase
MDQIEACVAYEINGKIVTDFPANIDDLNNATSSENIAMSAMNLALENALWQIHQTALRYR